MSEGKAYLSNDSLKLLHDWAWSQRTDATIQMSVWGSPQTITFDDGKRVTREADANQVEVWTQKHVMLSGVLSALDELKELRDTLKQATELLASVESKMRS